MDEITGFVLAGGRSTRMAADKAFADWQGRPLIDHALALVRSVVKTACILGPREKFAGHGEVIEDVYTDHGPLAGIHAALAASRTDLNLFLAVDVPFISPEFLGYLVEQARVGSAVVTVPRIGRRWQPLCAVYRRAFGSLAEAALRAGRNRIDTLYAATSVRVIDEHELQRLAFDPAMFENLNTQQELEQGRARQGRTA